MIGRVPLLFLIGAFLAVGLVGCAMKPDPAQIVLDQHALDSVLEPICAKYKLPSLAGAIFTTEGLFEIGVTGVRKKGDPTPVTARDLWHLGSDTKMMTATLAGTYVAEKKLSWNDKVISFFPGIADKVPAVIRNITLRQVLAHQAGLAANLDWAALSQSGSVTEQRLAAAEVALTAPAYKPGAFHYANTDYVVVGAILEKIGGKPWEELIRERLFKPLNMSSTGFGGLGTSGQIDQPCPHLADGTPTPTNGPTMDLPAILGPAGLVHCTMLDWSKFLVDQLRGGAGMKALLPNEIYQAMQTAVPPSPAGYGWGVFEKPWASGKALTHEGSNGMNYCVCWLAPAKKFGVLVCSNQGGNGMSKACDDAASALILRYQAKLKAQEPH